MKGGTIFGGSNTCWYDIIWLCCPLRWMCLNARPLWNLSYLVKGTLFFSFHFIQPHFYHLLLHLFNIFLILFFSSSILYSFFSHYPRSFPPFVMFILYLFFDVVPCSYLIILFILLLPLLIFFFHNASHTLSCDPHSLFFSSSSALSSSIPVSLSSF